MSDQRLPIPGQDDGVWGTLLNDFLLVAHNNDGTLKAESYIVNKADNAAVVHNTGNETIAGTKTFTTNPVAPTPTQSNQIATKGYVDLVASQGGAGPSLADVATSGSYNDLVDVPVFADIAASGSYTDLVDAPNFADVASTGSYDDLTNTPDLSVAALSGSYSDLINKPTLSTVAASGSYSDLTGKPSIPNDAGLVHTTGDESIAGNKSFTGSVTVGSNAVVTTNDSRLTNNRTPLDDSVSTQKLQAESVTTDKLATANTPTDGTVLSWSNNELSWEAPGLAPVESVNGQTGAVSLTKSNVGLGNVDNTSDANKPVSSATQTALNAKLPVAGGTLTGDLTLSGAPSSPNHAATKAYVDSQASGTQKLIIGTSEPTLATGQQVLWLDTSNGNVTLNLVTGD